MTAVTRAIVIGLDGLEPTIVDALLQNGDLPNLARLSQAGGYSRIATTCPAQTPVAWSTFATGTNPGGHGIFDFIRRDPATYRPDFSLNRYEQKNAFVPPKAVNLRRGNPIWSVLSAAGLESIVVRCPCTFPPDINEGDEFYFKIGSVSPQSCLICQAFYPTPSKRLSITVSKLPCN